MSLDDNTILDTNTNTNNVFKFIKDLGIDPTTFDQVALNDIINQYQLIPKQKIINTNKLLCDAAYEMAMTNIPEMSIPANMLILNGYINEKPIKILLDTGAAVSIIFTHAVNRLDLSELVDSRVTSELVGIGKETTIGKLWYIELQLDNYHFPISLTVSKNQIKEFDMILGLNFLQSYNAQIDFGNKKIRLNDKYDINFNY
jgi:hypothetical protein